MRCWENDRVPVVDSDKRLRLTPVEVSFSDRDYYYISSGLEEGVEIVVSAMGPAIEGMLLKPMGSAG